MRLDQHAGGEAQQGCGVGEDANDVGAPLELPIELERNRNQILRQCASGKSANAVIFSSGVTQQLGDGRELLIKDCRDDFDVLADSPALAVT